MRRKVVQIAGFTKVISLPSTWAKAHNLNKGDELEIREDGQNLVISSEKEAQPSLARIDLTKTDRFLRRFIDVYYRLGYDELEIVLSDDYFISLIQREVSERLLGFEIVEQKKGFCRIKSISTGVEEEFDIILKRIFMMLMTTSREGLELLRQKNYDRLDSLIKLEEINNKFTNFCQRHLNKHGNIDHKKATILYYTISLMETMADSFSAMFREIMENQKTQTGKNTIEFFSLVDSMIHDFYSMFYGFKTEKLVEFDNKFKQIVDNRAEWFRKGNSATENIVAYHLFSIANRLHHLSETVY
jgi:phosphate uptake regulator